MTKNKEYNLHITNDKAQDENRRIHISKEEAEYLRRTNAVRSFNEKHESRFTPRQKAIALGATVLMGLAVLTGIKEADRYSTAKSYNPSMTGLSFVGSEVKAAANGVANKLQEISGNDIEVGGTYRIKRGEHTLNKIAADLIQKYDISANPNAIAHELRELNPNLQKYPPQPGIVINIPKDVMSD